MTPRKHDSLYPKFQTSLTSVSPVRVVEAFHDKNIYILQNQITGQIEQYTGEQLEIYYRYFDGRKQT